MSSLERLVSYPINNYKGLTGSKLIDGSVLANDIKTLRKMIKYFQHKKVEVAQIKEQNLTVKFLIVKEY